MGQPTNLYDTYTAIGQAEDISELIFNIAPTETPILSAAGVSEATAKYHQWQTDVLDSPAANAAVEGDNPTLTEPDPTLLVGNYLQISNKAFGVSGTLEVTSKYGRDSEIAYQAVHHQRTQPGFVRRYFRRGAHQRVSRSMVGEQHQQDGY
jgi:hypothetical protein